jgi:hypothetical protein
VADFARVPSVGLFGPTKAQEFGFRFGPNVTIQARESMDEIAVLEVLAALKALIERPYQRTKFPLTPRYTMPVCKGRR